MRLVADLVRGQKVESINILDLVKEASRKLEKLVIVIPTGASQKLIWKKQVYLLKRLQ
jgi:hypothetical protein